jgi:hypothetical protein
MLFFCAIRISVCLTYSPGADGKEGGSCSPSSSTRNPPHSSVAPSPSSSLCLFTPPRPCFACAPTVYSRMGPPSFSPCLLRTGRFPGRTQIPAFHRGGYRAAPVELGSKPSAGPSLLPLRPLSSYIIIIVSRRPPGRPHSSQSHILPSLEGPGLAVAALAFPRDETNHFLSPFRAAFSLAVIVCPGFPPSFTPPPCPLSLPHPPPLSSCAPPSRSDESASVCHKE